MCTTRTEIIITVQSTAHVLGPKTWVTDVRSLSLEKQNLSHEYLPSLLLTGRAPHPWGSMSAPVPSVLQSLVTHILFPLT